MNLDRRQLLEDSCDPHHENELARAEEEALQPPPHPLFCFGVELLRDIQKISAAPRTETPSIRTNPHEP